MHSYLLQARLVQIFVVKTYSEMACSQNVKLLGSRRSHINVYCCHVERRERANVGSEFGHASKMRNLLASDIINYSFSD